MADLGLASVLPGPTQVVSGMFTLQGVLGSSGGGVFGNFLRDAQSRGLLDEPPPAISPEEMAEIDAAKSDQEQTSRPVVVLQTPDEISSAQADIQNILLRFPGIDPARIPIFTLPGGIDAGDEHQPPPEIFPEVSVLPEVGTEVEIPDVGQPDFLPGSGTDVELGGGTQPLIPDPGSGIGETTMADLGDILGNVGAVLGRIGGTIDFDPSTPGIFDDVTGPSLPDIIGGFVGGGLDPVTPSPTVTTPRAPTVATTCISQADSRIAAATGVSAAQVAQIRTLSRGRRRRRRMLTKSDVADISTMASLLGKSSEAFKTWLATQRLSR